jgi:RHS repeat-associated protein
LFDGLKRGIIDIMNRTLPSSSFSRRFDLPERRPKIPVSLSPWQPRGTFRKTVCSEKLAYLPANTLLPSNWRTTTEGPFGEVIRQTGPLAKANPFRFSTKYQDDESDLLYYGHRYFKTSTGTWLNRDLINERGGLNLYAFKGNDPIDYFDVLGDMTQSEIDNIKAHLLEKYAGKCCSKTCDHCRLFLTLSGSSIRGRYVTAKVKPDFDACVAEVHYFWWTCYQSAEESHGADNGRAQGWQEAGTSYTYYADPPWYTIMFGINGPGDPAHLAMEAQALVVVCFQGQYSVQVAAANGVQYTWDNSHLTWTGPGPEPGPSNPTWFAP